MLIESGWTEKEFAGLFQQIKLHKFSIYISKTDLPMAKNLLQEQTNLLVSLLENPTLVEHELFTELLRASFHLREELVSRSDLSKCGDKDLPHLARDTKRVYEMLCVLWCRYIHDLRSRYPYLFSFMVRMNPFNENRSAEVR
jgi:voltage-gated potassium channel